MKARQIRGFQGSRMKRSERQEAHVIPSPFCIPGWNPPPHVLLMVFGNRGQNHHAALWSCTRVGITPSDAASRGLWKVGQPLLLEGRDTCAHAGPMHKAGKRSEATPGHASHLQEPGRVTGIPALGTNSTQGDRGVNDSLRHLHPSGDSSGGKSARVTCVRSRSTEKGEMEKDKMKRGTDPSAERDTEEPRCDHMAACPPEARTFPPEVWASRDQPQPVRFPAPTPPEMTSNDCSHQCNVGKSHFRLVLLRSMQGFSACSLQRILWPSRVAEPTPLGA